MKVFGLGNFEDLPQVQSLSEEDRLAIKVIGRVLPFRTNQYVVDELIDWKDPFNDPMFRLTFMVRDLLPKKMFNTLADAVKKDAPAALLDQLALKMRNELNPHPAGQKTHNVPTVDGQEVPGVQHKYKETALLFPSSGQTCFAYCTFCFRWAQFIGDQDLKFATQPKGTLHLDYVREHKEISDVLITGGDPLVMRATQLRRFIEPMLGEGFEHIKNIRIGTKVLGFWPQRFLTDPDAEDLLKLFEEVNASGKQLAFMAHFNHWKELETEKCEEATKKIRETGTQIRTQSPVLRNINDEASIWSRMWTKQVELGMIPYYMFVERDTGPKAYFELPLVRTHEIYSEAFQSVSGLARTVRGPSMSAFPGKVAVHGISEIRGEKVFVLGFLQGREASWCNRPFFAKFDPEATWLDDLQPAFGENNFFFERKLSLLASNS